MKTPPCALLLIVSITACAAAETPPLLARRRSGPASAGGDNASTGISLLHPNPNSLVWDHVVKGGSPEITSFHGWLKVPIVHDVDRLAEDQPVHACLRVSAHSRRANTSQGPLLAHCGGPGADRNCPLPQIFLFPELADKFALLGIDQRGVPLGPDCSLKDGDPEGACGGVPRPCPFREANGDPVLPFPSATCDEIASRLENLTYEQQVSRMRVMLAELVGFDASTTSDEEMAVVMDVLRSGQAPVDVVHGVGFRSETMVRWWFRLMRLEHNLCVSAPRFTRALPNGGTLNTFAHMGTRELARDIDLLREAIGAPSVSFYGFSYGTVVAASYATLFPKRVGRLALDGVVPPSSDVRARASFAAQGTFSVVNGVLTECASSVFQGFPDEDRCPLAPGPSSKLAEMIADDENPSRASAAFALAIEAGNPSFAPDIMECLARLYNGSAAPACDLFWQGHSLVPGRRPVTPRPNRFHTLQAAVNGLDNPGRLSEEALVSWWRATLRAFPIGVGRGLFFAISIGSWPLYPRPLPPPGDGTLPALVVGNLHDLQTDYSGAQQMRAQFPAGALLTFQGYGHTSFGVAPPGDRCAELIARYLASGELPEDGHVCPSPILKLGPSQILPVP